MLSPTTQKHEAYNFYNEDIAIIGMDCLLPDACGVDELWQDLQYGRDHLREFPSKRSAFAQDYTAWLGMPAPEFRNGNYLPSVFDFDYRFFHITPKEAALMNPNQRLLLETVYRAIQDAGIREESIRGSNTGLFIGYIGDYEGSLYSRIVSDTQEEISATGNLASMSAGRIAHLLDLHGPAVLTDTACSSTLVALYQAYRAIQCGECRMAVAAGVRTTLMPDNRHLIGIESSDGVTRTFDKDADGTGIGEGVAAVLLKPMHDAVRDGDRIYAIIKGGAVNQDGTGIGMTAPNVNAQIDVLKTAWKNAGIAAQHLSYIEAHGTGTKLGDPIEVDGLTKSLRCFTDEEGFCAIGSVKSNYGHLYDCAGILSVMKTALMIYHRTIVPTVNFHEINPKIILDGSPFRIASRLEQWDPHHGVRLAGVSAFGFSGTNCHIVLSEFASVSSKTVPTPETTLLFTASAKSKESLNKLLEAYRILAYRLKDADLTAICMSSQLDRSHYRYRVAIPVHSMAQLCEKLEQLCDYGIAEDTISPCRGIWFGEAENAENAVPSHDPEILAKQYVTDAGLMFDVLYCHQKRYRMPLPLYPFAAEECCITIPVRSRFVAEAGENFGLPDVTQTAVTLTGDPDEKYTATELYIAEVFAEKMGFKSLAVSDDIYELGGDSITAYQIVSRINAERDTSLKMAEILEYRTIRAIAEHIDSLEPEKNSFYHIKKAEPAALYPLSFAQQRMYFLYLLDPLDVSYNMPFMIHIHGKLDTARFEEACRGLIRLHDAFRTHYTLRDGEAVQWVTDDEELRFVHMKGAPDEETLRNLRKPFDLERDVLIRVYLFHISEEEEYLVLIDMNHIAADGSSLGILISNLTDLYHGKFIERQEIQYTDFAVWQCGLDMEHYERYWLQKMQDLPEFDLPIDHMRTNGQSEQCEMCFFSLSTEQYSALRKCCVERKTGLFAFLFAAYQAALAAWLGVKEVITGTPISGRTAIETQSMVGMFVNVMPLRTRIERNASFTELIHSVHQSILEMLEYQDYPFDVMVDRLQITRQEKRNPVYDTVFAFQNMHIPEFKDDGLVTSMENADNISKFDITTEAMEQDGKLVFTMKYRTALFERDTILLWMERLHMGLEHALSAPEQEIGQLFESRTDTLKNSGFEEMDFDF